MEKITIELKASEVAFLKQYAEIHADFASESIIAVQIRSYRHIPPLPGAKLIYLYGEDRDEIETLTDLRNTLIETLIYTKKEIGEIMTQVKAEGVYSDVYTQILSQPVEVVYTPIAFFLTLSDARAYIKEHKYDLQSPRIYTYSCVDLNLGDLQQLTKLLRRIGTQL